MSKNITDKIYGSKVHRATIFVPFQLTYTSVLHNVLWHCSSTDQICSIFWGVQGQRKRKFSFML